MVAIILLIAFVLVAAFTDATRHKIYNWNTYPGIAIGLSLALLGAAWESLSPASAAEWQPLVGWRHWTDSLLGFAACGALMALCFVLFGAGGGDVKLLAMIGSFTGLESGLQIVLWTFIFAGCVGVAILVWKLGARRVAERAGQQTLAAATIGTTLQLPAEEKQILRLPVVLAPCVPLALLATFVPWPTLF